MPNQFLHFLHNESKIMKNLVKWYPVLVMVAIDQALAVSNILLKKILGDGINLWVFITYRQSISAIFLSPLAFFLERKTRPKLTFTILCHLFMSAIIGASVTQYLFLVGVEYTSATFSCAFLNMVPVITFLITLPFGLEKVDVKCSSGRAKVYGSLVCLWGAVVLIVYKGIPLFHFAQRTELLQHPHERWAIGSVALLGGTLCWSLWYLLQTSIGNKYPCHYSSTAIMTCFSALQSAVLSSFIDRDLSVWILRTKSDIFIILYTGIVGSGLCFVGMSWCVKKRGPVFTAAFSPLVMILAGMYEIPVLHQQLHLGSVLGSATVIAGLYILLWGKEKETQKQDPKLAEETGEIMCQEATEFRVVKIVVEPECSS
ncbi:nodulin MtN21 /EamA-like transporter family protein [Striga asiatica]|uniref:WAT1-related protein n=1 Tax=Striga asiatica TaxID=4170 RepID=A0A5A7RKU8_STRAF|nr:nodulin MtN21 /EamA-like transporter family protein [Striga asiatica]